MPAAGRHGEEGSARRAISTQQKGEERLLTQRGERGRGPLPSGGAHRRIPIADRDEATRAPNGGLGIQKRAGAHALKGGEKDRFG